MARDMCANITMEENYMRMSIEYNNDKSRKKIYKSIVNAEKEFGVYPNVIRKSISDTAGNFSVEFDYDSCQRTSGEFCESVIKDLGITHCEN